MKEDMREIKAMIVDSMEIMRTIQQDVLLCVKNRKTNQLLRWTEKKKYLWREHEGQFGYPSLTDSFDIRQETMDRTFEELEKVIAMRKVVAQGIQKGEDMNIKDTEETENEEEEEEEKEQKENKKEEGKGKEQVVASKTTRLHKQSKNLRSPYTEKFGYVDEENAMKKYTRKSAKEQRKKIEEELGIPSFIILTQSSNDPDDRI
ncbi:uncharacterized protein LOC112093302 [Morus notabilis]|uniref:uncharacterized protein LOC112093302 n=1 Tax=Morus notabilis TaxID=981085 RepID=UPI000CECEA38|nr:uncharacterized protein LOC112093302 [Morus notabilis]